MATLPIPFSKALLFFSSRNSQGFGSNMVSESIIVSLLLAALVLCTYCIVSAFEKFYTSHSRINVAAVGRPPGLLGRFRQPYHWMHNAMTLIQDGMDQYGQFGTPYKIQAPTRWNLFITSPEHIAEVKACPQSVMAFGPAADEQVRTEYTFYQGILEEGNHTPLMQKNMTQDGLLLLPKIVDEAGIAVETHLKISRNWTPIDMVAASVKLISQVSNHVFVGVPLNRDEGFQQAILHHATTVVHAATLLDKTPVILQPLVARLFLRRDDALGPVRHYVEPLFKQRRHDAQFSKSSILLPYKAPKPHDAIQWIVDASRPSESMDTLLHRFMWFQLASIHTTGNALTQLVYDLAENTEYQSPLRDELKSVLAETGGWNAKALSSVKLLDSCLKESGRLHGADVMTMRRRVMQPYTFKDGTHVPIGTWIAVPACALHRLDCVYDNPNKFDGFRFARMRERPGDENRFQFTTTSPEYVMFGHGASSCPGRWFAANELKVLMSELLLKYEWKFAEGVQRPKNGTSGIAIFPGAGKVLFRKLQNAA